MNNSIFSLQKRLLAIILLITFIFLSLMIRLAVVQLVNGNWLTTKAIDQWTRDLPLNAERGKIYDSNGVVLATSYTTYDIYVRPSMVDDAKSLTYNLVKILGGDFDEIYAKVTNHTYSEVRICMQTENEQMQQLKDLKLNGIYFSENSTRYYPYGDLLTQVLGFTTVDNVGQAGLEAYYNKYLTGVDGMVLSQSDVNGVELNNTLTEYLPSIAGCNLNLTIDVNIQQFCENALDKLMEEQKPKTATAVVMNCKTGEIVGLSSKPSYNLNELPRDDIDSLLSGVRNLAINDVYEPGSTFKVLTMASALDTGVAELTDHFYCPGYTMVDGEKIKCWKHVGHGSEDLTKGLCNSCNVVFVDLALRLGKDRLYEYFNKYGLGDTLGIDFLGEASGILMDIDNAKTVDYARMGFGQAIAVTPLQLITAICSVLNGGNLMKPYLVESVTDTNGQIIYKQSPSVIRKTVSEDTSSKIRVMFEEVVKNFSAFETFIPGYRVGGKTGTSQKYVNGSIGDTYISSFIGCIPADNPEYVVLIVADEPSSGNYFGSIVATPYAKLIFKDIIKYKNYAAVDLDDDLKRLEKNISLPNFVGKSLSIALAEISNLGLQCEVGGEGEWIISQSITPETMVCKNTIIILRT